MQVFKWAGKTRYHPKVEKIKSLLVRSCLLMIFCEWKCLEEDVECTIHSQKSFLLFLMSLWIMCNLHRSSSTFHPINSLQLHHPLHHYNWMAMPVNAMYFALFDNILPLSLPSSPSNEGPSGGMLPIDERLSSFLHCILWELLSYRPNCMWP